MVTKNKRSYWTLNIPKPKINDLLNLVTIVTIAIAFFVTFGTLFVILRCIIQEIFKV